MKQLYQLLKEYGKEEIVRKHLTLRMRFEEIKKDSVLVPMSQEVIAIETGLSSPPASNTNNK
jgi:hypothetical protein